MLTRRHCDGLSAMLNMLLTEIKRIRQPLGNASWNENQLICNIHTCFPENLSIVCNRIGQMGKFIGKRDFVRSEFGMSFGRYVTLQQLPVKAMLLTHGGTTEEGNCSYLLPLSHRVTARHQLNKLNFELRKNITDLMATYKANQNEHGCIFHVFILYYSKYAAAYPGWYRPKRILRLYEFLLS